MTIRISLGHIDTYDARVATFAHQLGLSGVQLHTPDLLPGVDGFWSLPELRALRERCDADGLAIDGLENAPLAHFWKIQRGLPGRDGRGGQHRRGHRSARACDLVRPLPGRPGDGAAIQ
ncbi:D-mannonate dehydratase [Kribbella aluminosa]|uniref:D-mannonate dehydratase n=1 Tax=Kribbella aluminosa TaxID=416017 RepID=A0ABS4UHQ3_9ACTN|nr:hypothetical protein [Kribbella aluminosa]MBP2351149.1 D-mannonate dehydratase [Kribbella aluminosa]